MIDAVGWDCTENHWLRPSLEGFMQGLPLHYASCVCVCVCERERERERERESGRCLVTSDFLQPHGCQVPVHEILQAKVLEWVAIPFSGESSQSRD